MRPTKKTDALILDKEQWRKLFLAMSIMTLALYVVAMICSLCGSKYFILNYQNAQMEAIEAFLRNLKIMPLVNCIFLTLEFSIILSFIMKRITRIWYPLAFYTIAVIVAILIPTVHTIFYTIYPFLFYLLVPLFEQFLSNKKINFKIYAQQLLLLGIAVLTTLILQLMILVIKAGYFDGVNHIQPLSAAFVYALEYDIALLVILYTISLFIYGEKGDSTQWVKFHNPGGSSQTSMTQSQKSLQKNLTKKQKNKIRWLYTKMYLIQLGTFLLLLVLPFLLGKVVEFLVMYLAFAISRYILGFKYSLHFKKEALCVSVSLIIFGSITLAVPFFYVVAVMAILFGVSLAILLHLSYKYKSLWLFNQAAKPDKFAVLYTFFDGNTDASYITTICKYKGLDHFQTLLIVEYMACEKMSYMAKKRNYSQRMLIYKLDEAIDKLLK